MKNAKKLIKEGVHKTLASARRIDALRCILDEHAIRYMRLDPALYEYRWWGEVDEVYTACRRALSKEPRWRHGPARVHMVLREAFDALSPHTALRGKVYCDLGCGNFHPYGISAVMYLNGAASCIALDLEDSDTRRAAEALADLLMDCMCFPEEWNWTGMPQDEFLARARQFDVRALQEGRLKEGVGNVPLRHVLTDIHDPVLEEESIDVMTSFQVLEHFRELGAALKRIHALMRPGAVGYHNVDITDHRIWRNQGYHRWSFLTEGEEWSDGLCNRLRSCEIRPLFEQAGFEILTYETKSQPMPEGFMQQVAGRFKSMSEEELSITDIFCVVRKG